MIALKRMGTVAAVLGLAAIGMTLMPGKAEAWWHGGWHGGWCCGVRFGLVLPPVVVAPAPVYAPPPVYYAPPPAYYPPPQRHWVPGHYDGPYWVPGHWA